MVMGFARVSLCVTGSRVDPCGDGVCTCKVVCYG